MKTVLVTGSSGALGKALTASLAQEPDYRTIVTNRRGDDGGVLLDVRDSALLADALGRAQPDLILHLAATFVHDFDEAYSVNVEATRQLLEVVQHSNSPTRVVLIGSAAEYGMVRPEENPIREDHVLRPVSIYGLTKAWQTQLAALYHARGVDVVVARIFNLDGPGVSERLFVGRLQRQIQEVMAGRQSVIELGSLSATRDYVSTEAAADQVLAIAAHAESGDVYHVASGTPITMRKVLERYLSTNGLDVSVVSGAAELSNRTGIDVPAIYADVTKTTQLLELWRSSVEA